ncbi:MAG TPA: SRPBCC family protein, partial [Steroidobacter sp.]|nr:SRPBCC family protein [Steroidobacter sp.]
VTELDERRSEWSARMPGGVQLRWQAEIVEDQPGRLLSWRTIAGSEINHVGSVRFEPAPDGDGAQIRVEVYYGMPGGAAAVKAAELVSMAPEAMVSADLRRLKQLIETGEITTTRGQPAGRRSLIGRALSRRES